MTDEMRRLEQLQALKAANSRVLEVLHLMVPLIEELAMEGNSLAKYLLGELDKANLMVESENLSAREFLVANNIEPPQ